VKQELENILPNEVATIKEALRSALMSDIPKDTRDMIGHALRIIDYRQRGQAENNRLSLEAFAADCARHGSD